MTNKEAYEILEKYIRCSNSVCPPVDCDKCHRHVTAKQLDEALQVAMDALKEPEQSDYIAEVNKKDDENRIDKTIQKYKSLSEQYYVKARQEYQKYINYQDEDYKAASDNAMKNSTEFEYIARWLAELKELKEQKPIESKMFKVMDGKDPYTEIGKYIRNHITVIEDIIATIEIDGIRTNELFMVDMQEDGCFVWKSDWYEGEQNIALIDFFPVSEAEPDRKNASVGCTGCRYDQFGDPRCSKCARSFQDYYEADMRSE